MTAISIAGVELPVSFDSLRVKHETIGTVVRNANGVRMMDRRASKRTVSFDIVLSLLDDAMLFKYLLTGEGDYWSAQADLISSKGNIIGGTNCVFEALAVTNYASTGAARVLTTGDGIAIPQGYDYSGQQQGGTMVFWQWMSAGPTRRIVALSWRYSDTVPFVARERIYTGTFGAPQAYSATNELVWSVTPGSLVIGTKQAATSGEKSAVADVLFLPRYFPAAQLDALLAGVTVRTSYLPRQPAVAVAMDLYPPGQVSGSATESKFAAHGDVEMFVKPHWRGGSFVQTGSQLNVTLVEI